MKRMFLIVLLAMPVTSVAISQVSRPISIYLGAGVSPLSGDFGDVWNLGFHGTFGLGITAAPGFQIVPKVEYHSFPIDKQGLPISGGTLHSFMIGGAVLYQFGLPAASSKPFVTGGFGVSNVSASNLSGGGLTFVFDDETKAYFEFGGGVIFRASPSTQLFVMARFVSVSTEGESLAYIPFTFGFKF